MLINSSLGRDALDCFWSVNRFHQKSKKTYVISINTDGYQWLEGSAYWESPTLGIPSTEENKKSLKEHLEGKKKQRKGV